VNQRLKNYQADPGHQDDQEHDIAKQLRPDLFVQEVTEIAAEDDDGRHGQHDQGGLRT